MEPILGLISGLGEGIIWVIQTQVLGMTESNKEVLVKPGEDIIASTATYAAAGAGIGGTIAGGIAGATGSFIVPGLGTAVGTGGGFVIGGFIGGAIGGLTGLVSGLFKSFTVNKEHKYYFPLYAISPQEIFAGQIPALDVNFINPDTSAITSQDEDGTVTYNTAAVLSPQIAKWYVALRNLVLVGLMVVLLYIGIRIVISSTAGEKAKYKEHIKDWIVAVLLVVFLHYIMAFALTMTEYITGILVSQNTGLVIVVDENQIQQVFPDNYQDYKVEGQDAYAVRTNLLGFIRFHQQEDRIDENGNPQVTWNYVGQTIIYVVLVIYTVMFLIIYFKRVIYMAFLTVIAPLVALTYPIDKISDGQAQAFNMWIKEYVYNLLLQPFHLLLYTLLIGSVMDLAGDNMIYALVALGFLIPAEKLLRRFFGFDQKAPEAGSIVGGVVGGSLAMSAINKIGNIGSLPSRRNKENNSSSGNEGGAGNRTRLTERKADKGKESTDQLIENVYGVGGSENQANAQVGAGTQGSSNGTLRFSSVSSGSASGSVPGNTQQVVSGGSNTNSQGFDAEEDLELPNTFKKSVKGDLNDAKDWAMNLKPIRFSNEKIAEARNKYQNWTKETPRTAVGRDAKKLVIRGVKSVKPALGTAKKYTGKALASVGKKVPRVATKAALGATMGTIGVAAGIASGDLSNIVAYGAAATSVGAKVGDGVSNVAGNIGDTVKDNSGQIREDYMSRRYTKDERRKIQNDKADKEWQKSKEVISQYKDEFGKEYKQAMKHALEFRRYGVVDDKAIISELKHGGLKAPDNRAILNARASSMVKTEKDLQDFNKRLAEKGVSDEDIKSFNKDIRLRNDM